MRFDYRGDVHGEHWQRFHCQEQGACTPLYTYPYTKAHYTHMRVAVAVVWADDIVDVAAEGEGKDNNVEELRVSVRNTLRLP